jgi:HAD superfamily hydrolase (TIGR01549 family)
VAEPPPPKEPDLFLDPPLAIIFDLDGTLVLSHHDFGRMRKEAIRIAESYGVLPGKLSVSEPVPRILDEARGELERAGIPEGQRIRFDVEVNRRIDAIELEALPNARARPAAIELLRALTERGFRLGLLTRSSEEFTRRSLRQTGLLDFFPYLRTRSHPGPPKPSPEALRSLLEDMGVPPDRAVSVGDHLLDAECATRARVRFLGVLPEPPEPVEENAADRLRSAGALGVARDLTELGRFLGVRLAPVPAPHPP